MRIVHCLIVKYAKILNIVQNAIPDLNLILHLNIVVILEIASIAQVSLTKIAKNVNKDIIC